MTTLTEEILNNLIELPPEMQSEALDFIRFLKTKLAQTQTTMPKPNGSTLAELLEQAAKQNLFADIDDPVIWQREIRQDRLIVGRE